MGCDIHCYVEYKPPNYDTWISFGGRINPGRNYAIFTKMAGVRNYSDIIIPIDKPRGLPENAAWNSNSDNILYVSDSDEDDCVKPNKAKQWVENGFSKYIYSEGKPTWVTHPDWHSHSWLTTDEFRTVLSSFDVSIYLQNEYEWWAILAILESFERRGCEARLVFWFDN